MKNYGHIHEDRDLEIIRKDDDKQETIKHQMKYVPSVYKNETQK